MSKIKFESLSEATIKTTNSVDETKVYDISANVRITDTTHVSSVEGGYVKKDGKTVCTFSTYNEGQLNTNFQNVYDVSEMCAILQAISDFMGAVNDEVANGTAIVINE